MSKSMQTIKNILEIIALAVGLVIASTTLWQGFKPSGQLIAEVTSTKIDLPLELSAKLNDLPEQVGTAVTNSLKQSVDSKTLSQAVLAARTAAVGATTDNAGFSLSSVHFLFMATVRNNTPSTLTDVCLRFPFSQGSFHASIYPESEPARSVELGPILRLGDLRPLGEVRVVIWSWSALLDYDVQVTHSGGIGSVWFNRPVPQSVSMIGGYWLSYRTLAFGFAISFLLIAIFLLYRRLRVHPPQKQGA